MRPIVRAHLAATIAVLASLAATPAPAGAQTPSGADIDLQAFRPAMDSRGFVTVDSADILGPRQLSIGLVTTWADDVLRLDGPGGATYSVDTLLSPTLLAAIGVRPLGLPLELGVALPFGVMAGDRGPDSDGATPSPNDDQRYHFGGQGIGNLGLRAKVRLRSPVRRGQLGLAIIAGAWLPTATAHDSWLADDATVLEGRLVAEHTRRRWRLAATAGLRAGVGGAPVFRDVMTGGGDQPPPPVTGASVAGGAAIAFGGATSFALVPGRFDLIGEVFGALPIDTGGVADQSLRPLEALAGIKVYLARSSYLTLGAGTSLVPGAAGSPDARAFLGIVFEPRRGDRDDDGRADDIDACPGDPEDLDGFHDDDGCPDPDNDHDRIPDVDDRCPEAPEDRDGVDDEDGCPDGEPADRDGDGILDDLDRCPDAPEDFDDFEDADGCPDPDNDRDQILDHDDLCPNAPEDRDDFEDTDGCPDPDNDRDQILDRDDKCPRKPETYNGVDDEDGCPDGRSLTFEGDALVLDNVYFQFNSAVIDERSHPILRAVARTILANPDIARLEVQGHTDERGGDAYNLRLSQARAEAVRTFLITEGVDSARLDAQGYGERVPLVRRRGPAAWARNRRVEFVIRDRITHRP